MMNKRQKQLQRLGMRVAFGLGLGALLLLGGTAGLSFSSGPAVAQEIIRTTGRPIRIERNKGTMIRLSQPAQQVFIADPNIADIQIRSPRLVYVFGRTPGETTFTAVGEDENILANSRVVVSHNVSRLRGALNRMLPENGIDIESVDGAIILSGQVSDPTEAENARLLASRFAGEGSEVINNMQVRGPNQINLRVRIVEMSRSALRDIGVNWSAIFEQGAFLAGIFTGGSAVQLPGRVVRPTLNLSNPSLSSIQAVVRLLQQRGLIRVLAEPNLTAISGETAHFLAGGEFPIPVAQDRDQITIEFKRFGVSLSFTPVILAGNRISLKVAPEVSQLSTEGSVQLQGFSIPSLTTRRAETTVELTSGQSLVIAGLLQRNMTGDLSQVPGIGEVPVVGRLFQSERFQRNETELVIIVTPFIVRPQDDQAAAERNESQNSDLPYRDPGRFLVRRDEEPEAARNPQEDPVQLHGPHGFILE